MPVQRTKKNKSYIWPSNSQSKNVTVKIETPRPPEYNFLWGKYIKKNEWQNKQGGRRKLLSYRHSRDGRLFYVVSCARNRRPEVSGRVRRWADGRNIEQEMAAEIRGERPLGRPRARLKDYVTGNMIKMQERAQVDLASDTGERRKYMTARSGLKCPVSCARRRRRWWRR